MEWMLHHVNVPAHDVRETAGFFRNVIGLCDGSWIYPDTQGDLHHEDDGIAYFGIENRGLHVVRSIPTFARDNGFMHNPTIGGHFAISVADIDALKARLDRAAVPYSDAGIYAMAGIHQIYCYDPSFNVIEINQIKSPLPKDAVAGQDPSADVALRHAAIPAHDVRQSAAFFRDVIGLAEASTADDRKQALFQANGQGLRLIKPSATYAREHGFLHNPTLDAHFAMIVPTLDDVANRLDEAGIAYTEAGKDPIDGEERIFTYTPSMRLLALLEGKS
ncbi:MAG: VOC family protein [Geminicoccaceae bacterium]